MKQSQIANLYTLELTALAFPQWPDLREALTPALLDPSQARGARDFIMGCLKSLGYDPHLLGAEAARVARKAMQEPDPLAAVRAEAGANPLSLTDEEAALRAWGLGVEEAKG